MIYSTRLVLRILLHRVHLTAISDEHMNGVVDNCDPNNYRESIKNHGRYLFFVTSQAFSPINVSKHLSNYSDTSQRL